MKKKLQKPESEIVREYAEKIIHRHITRGHADRVFKNKKTTNKDLWMDTDFYFSVVFQSSKQKMAFLNAVKWMIEDGSQIQIVNSLKLADAMNVKLERESMGDSPTGDLDLRPFVLDNEKM